MNPANWPWWVSGLAGMIISLALNWIATATFPVLMGAAGRAGGRWTDFRRRRLERAVRIAEKLERRPSAGAAVVAVFGLAMIVSATACLALLIIAQVYPPRERAICYVFASAGGFETMFLFHTAFRLLRSLISPAQVTEEARRRLAKVAARAER